MLQSSSGRLRSICIAGCALSVAGCAATPPPATSRPSKQTGLDSVAAVPGELRMRHPDELGSSAARTRALGVLQPVQPVKAIKARPASRSRQLKAASPRTVHPIRVARDSVPVHYTVRGQLLLPSGLIIHGVPPAVSVRRIREQGGGDVWEIVDARGARLALLKAESLSRSLVPKGRSIEELASARSVGRRDDWGAPAVRVVSERFLSESYVYTIERRAKGTSWISRGLELSAPDARGAAR